RACPVRPKSEHSANGPSPVFGPRSPRPSRWALRDGGTSAGGLASNFFGGNFADGAVAISPARSQRRSPWSMVGCRRARLWLRVTSRSRTADPETLRDGRMVGGAKIRGLGPGAWVGLRQLL